METLFVSQRIFLGNGCDNENFIDGAILVTTEVDTNVHIYEPGHSDWEGFVTATKAAAAGGITTIIDMPMYNIPPTITTESLKTKAALARGKCFIDVGLWGGLTSENIKRVEDVENLMKSGVIGLVCSLCPTQSNEFSNVNKSDIQSIIKSIEKAGNILAFHPEVVLDVLIKPNNDEPKKYKTFLDTRPSSMEKSAVEIITQLSTQNKSVRIHILNLSSADTIPLINEAKIKGANLTVETCPHYLAFDFNSIEETQTEFKCYPPIRSKENQEKLWKAIIDGDIDIISSNHMPTLPGIKYQIYGKTRGDFLKAWAGIASLQLGLSVFWTKCQKYGLGVKDIHRLFCANPAKLCGISHVKGIIKEGFDADFCIWDPDEEFLVQKDELLMQNKSTPYMNMKLKGLVHATIIRGLFVYQRYSGFSRPLGRVILKRPVTKRVVKFS